ncbi:MAG: hypothetical protein M3R17_16050 [Bacteroidota bacterium]|nr:hypothetical protein [Bacteroidota bacterium]
MAKKSNVKESKEPDLYVINTKLTDKDKKEISDFINAYKERAKQKKAKQKKCCLIFLLAFYSKRLC